MEPPELLALRAAVLNSKKRKPTSQQPADDDDPIIPTQSNPDSSTSSRTLTNASTATLTSRLETSPVALFAEEIIDDDDEREEGEIDEPSPPAPFAGIPPPHESIVFAEDDVEMDYERPQSVSSSRRDDYEAHAEGGDYDYDPRRHSPQSWSLTPVESNAG